MAKKQRSLDASAVLSNLEKGSSSKSKSKLYVYSKRPQEDTSEENIIPFGVPEIDEASGIGGLRRGRLVELFGPESGGKSYLAIKAMASAQKRFSDKKVGLIDVEHSFVAEWASMHGVNVDDIVIGQDFDHGEDALDNMRALVESGICSLVVLDSTAALIPKAELEAELTDSKVAEHARIMSRGVKQIMDAAAKTNTSVVFINQTRTNVGVMFGNPETTPGGKALKFYSHMRMRVRRKDYKRSKDEDSPIGILSCVKFVKNKLARPFVEADFVIYFTPEGNDSLVQLAKLAHETGAIRRKTVEGEKKFNWGTGKSAVLIDGTDYVEIADWLVKNDKVKEMLESVKEKAKEKEVELPQDVLDIEDQESFESPLKKVDGEKLKELEEEDDGTEEVFED